MAHIFTPALRRPLSKPFAKSGTRTLIQRAISSLRARGSDAHLWLPGVGTLNGLTTGNYLESTGNTLATVDNPTGLVLDALGTVGVELAGVLSSNTPWTAGVMVGDNLSITNATGATTYPQTNLLTAASNISLVSISVVSQTSVCSVANQGGAFIRALAVGSNVFLVPKGSDTKLIFIMPATTTLVISSLSVREVSGIHLQQAATASKPLVQRGAWNLLTNSVLAGGTSGTCGSGAVAPTSWSFPVNTGAVVFASQTVRFTATAQRPMIAISPTLAVGSYIWSGRVEAGSHTRIDDVLGATAGTSTISVITFKKNNVVCTVIEPVSAGDVVSALFSITGAGAPQLRFGLGCAGASTGDITLSQPQLELGTTASDYSPTTTAPGSNPDSGKFAWRFDGSNDYLSLGSVPFQMGDDHCVVAGVSPLSDVNPRIFVSNGTTARIGLYATNTGYTAYWKNDAGTGTYVGGGIGSRVGYSDVVSLRSVSSSGEVRCNSVRLNTAGTLPALPATLTTSTIGSDSGPSNFMNGSIGPVIFIKGTVSDAELLMYERLVAALTPNGPVF